MEDGSKQTVGKTVSDVMKSEEIDRLKQQVDELRAQVAKLEAAREAEAVHSAKRETEFAKLDEERSKLAYENLFAKQAWGQIQEMAGKKAEAPKGAVRQFIADMDAKADDYFKNRDARTPSGLDRTDVDEI